LVTLTLTCADSPASKAKESGIAVIFRNPAVLELYQIIFWETGLESPPSYLIVILLLPLPPLSLNFILQLAPEAKDVHADASSVRFWFEDEAAIFFASANPLLVIDRSPSYLVKVSIT